MYRKLEVLAFGGRDFKKLLKDHIDYEQNAPLESALKETLGGICKSVVVERGYVDKDYQDEFSAYYSKAFKQYPQRCMRLHFFSKKISQQQLDGFDLPTAGAYLGFTIVRPIDLQRMGRTVLKPRVTEEQNAFITCQTRYSAHLSGQELTVSGMPFIQQDTQVGACAQAALWMLGRYMSRRFRTREFLPAEINQFAKLHNPRGRLLPAERGLTTTQMLDALHGMGLSAELVWVGGLEYGPRDPFVRAFKGRRGRLRNTAKLADIAYRYIESGLPVIFGTRNHAVVGIGHSYDSAKRVSLAIERIPSFFVNNDAEGPYKKMPILRRSGGGPSFREVEHIFVVAPHEATLGGEAAEDMAKDSLSYLMKEQGLTVLIRKMRSDLASMLSQLEFRTYLKPTVELQEELLRNVGEDSKGKVAQRLLRLDYPKYVWITEVSSAKLLNTEKKEERKCLGRVIVDSTAPKGTFGTIAIHFADVLMLSDRQMRRDEEGACEWYVAEQSTPFVHMFTSESVARA